MVWDAHSDETSEDIDLYEMPYRLYDYFPLENIDDLINQYNYAGFHDICIYPELSENIPAVHDPELSTTKGLSYLFGGYVSQNSTATNLFVREELLATIFFLALRY